MTFVEDLVLSLDVGPAATQIGCVTFANDAIARFFLNKYSDSLDIVGELMAMRRQSGGTNTAQALQITREQLLQQANGARTGTIQVVIVITDGKSRDTTATLEQAANLREQGVVVFSIGVGTNLDMDELKGIAGAKRADTMYTVETFDSLVSLTERIIEATCNGEVLTFLHHDKRHYSTFQYGVTVPNPWSSLRDNYCNHRFRILAKLELFSLHSHSTATSTTYHTR